MYQRHEGNSPSLPREFRSTMYRTYHLFRVGGHSDVTSRFRRRLSRYVECTPKVRQEIKGPITLNGGEQCLCPDNSIPAN